MPPSWKIGPQRPQIEDATHLWRWSLEVPPAKLGALAALLSDDERRRLEDFRRDDLRRRFAVGRAGQRLLLARYLGESPDRLQFDYQPLGRPLLAAPWHGAAVAFNLSNSGEMAVLAVGGEPTLGVDIERIRPLRDLPQFARRFFAAEECAWLAAQPEMPQREGFFRLWTRKEAVLKATGKGLTFPLDQVVVSADAPARVLRMGDDAEEARRWTLHHFEPAAGYVGAAALRGEAGPLKCWTLALEETV